MDGKFAPKRGTRCWLFEALERLSHLINTETGIAKSRARAESTVCETGVKALIRIGISISKRVRPSQVGLPIEFAAY